MNKARIRELETIVHIVLSLVLLSGCGQISTSMLTPTLTTVPTVSLTSTITPVPTNTKTPEPTPTEEVVRDFPVLDLDHFEECKLNGINDYDDYVSWVKGNVQDVVLAPADPSVWGIYNANGGRLRYGKIEGRASISELPFSVGFSYCSAKGVYVKDDVEYPYDFIVTPVVFSVPFEPEEKVVILVKIRVFDNFPGGTSQYLQWVKDNWVGNVALLLSPISGRREIVLNPIAGVMDQRFPDIDNRIAEWQMDLDPRHIAGMIFEATVFKETRK